MLSKLENLAVDVVPSHQAKILSTLGDDVDAVLVHASLIGRANVVPAIVTHSSGTHHLLPLCQQVLHLLREKACGQ